MTLTARETQMLEALKNIQRYINRHPWSALSGSDDMEALTGVGNAIAACEPRKCGVGWKDPNNPNKSCGNPATHRAISTSGKSTTVFHVCEECARLGAELRYRDFMGDSQMLPGDPLWLIWPPLDSTPEQSTKEELIDALKRADEAMNQCDWYNVRSKETHSIVRAVLQKAEPKPHKWSDRGMGEDGCRLCDRNADDPIHIKPKPRRFIVRTVNPGDKITVGCANYSTMLYIESEVNPITGAELSRAWAKAHEQGSVGKAFVRQMLRELGIEVEG